MDYLILLSSIALGAVTVFGLRLNDPRHVKVLNAFTGAYLLTLVMLHLLPDLYEPEAGVVLKPLVIGGFILFGFFLQIAMDSISMGIEH
ncbi:MAG: ZIP family metal transporter, partial [Verrucomicrobia bacterium]|nr:ZIP family metal transporter [Verrucomicrobiota bacterium]